MSIYIYVEYHKQIPITNGGDKFEECIRQWERMLPRVNEAYDQKARGVLVMRSRLNPAYTSHATASESHTETQMSQNNASNLPHRVFSLPSQSSPSLGTCSVFTDVSYFPSIYCPGVSRLRDTRANRRQPINSSGLRKGWVEWNWRTSAHTIHIWGYVVTSSVSIISGGVYPFHAVLTS